MKRNGKLTLPIVLGIISVLALSVWLSPVLNMAVKAQGRNVTEGVQKDLTEITEKIRDLASNTGVNLTLPQGGNLSERLQTLVDSAPFKNLSQQLSQQLSQLGINGSNIQSLQQESETDFSDLVEKLQNLTSSRGGGQ
jgi:predicted metalloenzyme YecM